MTGILKVDTIQEHTATKGVAIQGKTDGQAVASGYVGEVFGTERAGTGGSAFNTQTTTDASSTGVAVISLTLNKGIYLVNVISRQAKSLDATESRLSLQLRIGTTAVSSLIQGNSTAISGAYMTTQVTEVVKISTDNTVVDCVATTPSITPRAGFGLNEMFAVRIA
jgi:hypothetical protein